MLAAKRVCKLQRACIGVEPSCSLGCGSSGIKLGGYAERRVRLLPFPYPTPSSAPIYKRQFVGPTHQPRQNHGDVRRPASQCIHSPVSPAAVSFRCEPSLVVILDAHGSWHKAQADTVNGTTASSTQRCHSPEVAAVNKFPAICFDSSSIRAPPSAKL